MPSRIVTKGMVLRRTNYGEADRILAVLTPDQGKLSLMARGVRKARSKLAGGIELFSINQITFLQGRGEVSTLISSRLERHFSSVVKDLARTRLGYDFLKLIDKNTEQEPEVGYFELLTRGFEALDQTSLPLDIIKIYFEANLLKLAGHAPNLTNNAGGRPLEPRKQYSFDASVASFTASDSGQYSTDEIKFLRLLFSGNSPKVLARITDSNKLAAASQPLITAMLRQHLR